MNLNEAETCESNAAIDKLTSKSVQPKDFDNMTEYKPLNEKSLFGIPNAIFFRDEQSKASQYIVTVKELHSDSKKLKRPYLLRENKNIQNNSFFRSLIRIVQMGKGGFGEVWFCLDRLSKKFLAHKTSKEETILTLTEVQICEKIIEDQNPSLLKIYQVVLNGQSNYEILMEYGVCDLHDYCTLNLERFSNRDLLGIAEMLKFQLDLLEELQIYHRDVKPKNLIIFSDGNIKLTDFGLSVETKERKGQFPICGTPGFCSKKMESALEKSDTRLTEFDLKEEDLQSAQNTIKELWKYTMDKDNSILTQALDIFKEDKKFKEPPSYRLKIPESLIGKKFLYALKDMPLNIFFRILGHLTEREVLLEIEKWLFHNSDIMPNGRKTFISSRLNFFNGQYSKSIEQLTSLENNTDDQDEINDQLFKNEINQMIGTCLGKEGHYSKALEHYEKSRLYETNKDYYYLLKSDILRKQQQFQEAQKYLSLVSINGITLQDVGYYDQLGAIHQANSKFKEALEYFQKTLQIRLQHIREANTLIAFSYDKLGGINSEYLGQPLIAKDYFQKSLQIKIKTLGENHLYVSHSCEDLGLLLTTVHRYYEAQLCLDKAYQIKKSIFKRKNIQTAINQLLKANLLRTQDKFEEALKLFNSTLAIFLKVFGARNIKIAQINDQIGSLLHKRKENDKALEILNRSLYFKKTVCSSDHLEIVRTNCLIGDIITPTGDYEKASEIYSSSLTTIKNLLGEKNIEIADLFFRQSILQKNKGELKAAIQSLNKSLKIYFKFLGSQNPKIVQLQFTLAKFFQEFELSSQEENILNRIEINQRLSIQENSHQTFEYLENFSEFFQLKKTSVKIEQ